VTVALPPCGLYRTTRALGEIPAGRLVYFHNHGEPGAGIYLPSGWSLNRVRWHERGNTLPDDRFADTLEPLAAEGLYRVREELVCCDKRCQVYAPQLLVQLGYNGEGDAILFVPEWTGSGLGFPERGTKIDKDRVRLLEKLAVAEAKGASPAGGMVH
jgi:hypothetical protein